MVKISLRANKNRVNISISEKKPEYQRMSRNEYEYLNTGLVNPFTASYTEGVDRGGGGTGVEGAESGVEGAESGVEGAGSGGRGGGKRG